MGNIRFKKICAFCGKEFMAQKASTQYCCTRCSQKAYKKRMRETAKRIIEADTELQKKKEEERKFTEVMNVRLAAMYLGVGKSTIYRYIEAGIIQAMHMPGKTLIRKVDIDRLFNNDIVYTKKRISHKIDNEKDYITIAEIAEKYDMSFSGAFAVLNKEKLESVKFRGRSYYQKKEVTRLFKKIEAEKYPEITDWTSRNDLMKEYNMTGSAISSFAWTFCIPSKVVKGNAYYSTYHFKKFKERYHDFDKTDPAEEKYYTVDEAMAKYNLTKRQVYHFLRYYHIERKKFSKYVKFLKADFDKYVNLPAMGDVVEKGSRLSKKDDGKQE